MKLPVNPPLLPMLAKRRSDLPRGRRLDLRAEVGRLPRARLPRRRRGVHPEPRREAARPLLPRARARHPRRSCPTRCVLDGEIVIATGERARLRGAAAAAAPGRLAREDARRERCPRRSCFWDLLCVGDEISARRRSTSGAPALEALLAGATPPHPPDARDDRPRRRRGLVRALRGRGPRRRHGQAGRRARTSRTSASCSR